MSPGSIGDALFTKTQQRVLGLLYGNPDKSFYTNEIMRWAAMGRGTIRRELDRLVSVGLVMESRAGNQLHYRANLANPVFHELAGIVRKTFGIGDVIREALATRSKDIVAAFVYGSIAKGTDTASSDIDVLVITDKLSYGDVVELVQPYDQKLGREINPVVFATQEFIDKLSTDVAFVTRVMEQPKIMLIGSEDDIPKSR